MTNKQKERIEYSLNVIRHEIDRLDAKMDKADAEGDEKRYEKLDRRQDLVLDKLEGMKDVLAILGYTVREYVDKPWEIHEWREW